MCGFESQKTNTLAQNFTEHTACTLLMLSLKNRANTEGRITNIIERSDCFCTCAYKTGAASVNEIIIVGQDKGAPLLHLQAVLTTGDSIAAVHLGGLEVLRTQPGLINHLGGKQRGERILMS